MKDKRTQRNIRPLRESIAVIVDGQTEQWYIEQVKTGYRPKLAGLLKITPELPQKKTVRELFSRAKELVEKEYTRVFLILDLDEILRDAKEYADFKYLYSNYETHTGRNKWMEKLTVVVNAPCLEYWYLLHFNKTNRFYPDYNGLLKDLKKCPCFKDYDKSYAFYHKTPNIYQVLSAKVDCARGNAREFDPSTMNTVGCSEMFRLFDYIDGLDKT